MEGVVGIEVDHESNTKPQQTPYTSPTRPRYGMSIVTILEKTVYEWSEILDERSRPS